MTPDFQWVCCEQDHGSSSSRPYCPPLQSAGSQLASQSAATTSTSRNKTYHHNESLPISGMRSGVGVGSGGGFHRDPSVGSKYDQTCPIVNPTAAQLDQWRTYCCDKEDCTDGFSQSDLHQLAGIATSQNLGDDVRVLNHLVPPDLLASYCCPNGSNCHEPMTDDLQCGGQPGVCFGDECCTSGKCPSMNGGWECNDAACLAERPFPATQQHIYQGNHSTSTPSTPFHDAITSYAGPNVTSHKKSHTASSFQDPGVSMNETIEAFLTAVARGETFGEQRHLSSDQSLTGAGLVSPGHLSRQSQENTAQPTSVSARKAHVCHWQNCHSSFSTVQELLSHVSFEHLKMGPPTSAPEPPYEFGRHQRSVSTTSDIVNGFSALPTRVAPDSKAENLNADYSVNNLDPNDWFRNLNATTPTVDNQGLMACLWDDCLPGQIHEPTSSTFNAAFNSECQPATADPSPQGLEALRLLSQPSHTESKHGQATSPLPPPASTRAQKICHAPVATQNNNPLDSASAVLKHLLEQHLGTDATKSLLDIAQTHYQSIADHEKAVSRGKQPTHSLDTELGKPKEESRQPAATIVQAKPSNAQTFPTTTTTPVQPTSRDSVSSEDSTIFTCRWYGCDKTFACTTSLTEHISADHIGKGKSEYECLWEGCATCSGHDDQRRGSVNDDTAATSGGDVHMSNGSHHPGASEHPAVRGRVFATRQKVLRHVQSHTGKFFSAASFYKHASDDGIFAPFFH